jgi:hypothetical protein
VGAGHCFLLKGRKKKIQKGYPLICLKSEKRLSGEDKKEAVTLKIFPLVGMIFRIENPLWMMCFTTLQLFTTCNYMILADFNRLEK